MCSVDVFAAVPCVFQSLLCTYRVTVRLFLHGSLSLLIDCRGVYCLLSLLLGYRRAISGVCDLVKTGWAGGQDLGWT